MVACNTEKLSQHFKPHWNYTWGLYKLFNMEWHTALPFAVFEKMCREQGLHANAIIITYQVASGNQRLLGQLNVTLYTASHISLSLSCLHVSPPKEEILS